MLRVVAALERITNESLVLDPVALRATGRDGAAYCLSEIRLWRTACRPLPTAYLDHELGQLRNDLGNRDGGPEQGDHRYQSRHGEHDDRFAIEGK